MSVVHLLQQDRDISVCGIAVADGAKCSVVPANVTCKECIVPSPEERVIEALRAAGFTPTSTSAGADPSTRIVFRKSGFAVEAYRGETVKVTFRIAGQISDAKLTAQMEAYVQALRAAGYDALVKIEPRTHQQFLLVVVTDTPTLPASSRLVPPVKLAEHSAEVRGTAQVVPTPAPEYTFPERPAPVPVVEYDPTFIVKARRALVECQAESFRNGMKRAFARALVAWLYGERQVQPTGQEYCLIEDMGDIITRKIVDLFHADADDIVRRYRLAGLAIAQSEEEE